MKYCPNPDCTHRIDVGKPAEFLEEIQVCSDCGTQLQWGEAIEAVIPEPGPEVVVPWVAVATFSDSYQAQFAKGRLEAEGIPVMFLGEHNVTVKFLCNCGFGEIKLMVPELDAPAAREILTADYSGMVPDDVPGPTGID